MCAPASPQGRPRPPCDLVWAHRSLPWGDGADGVSAPRTCLSGKLRLTLQEGALFGPHGPAGGSEQTPSAVFQHLKPFPVFKVARGQTHVTLVPGAGHDSVAVHSAGWAPR